MSDSFWNFGITTALLFWRKKKNMDLLQRKQEIGG